MTVDRLIRWAAALAVLAVAVVAGVISYGHIETLALANGQPLLAARLLPVSVDGAILASSMVLLDAARRAVRAPALARIVITLAVTATLAANAEIGAAHGLVGILVSAWPAVAFIGSAEVVLGMARGLQASALEDVPEGVVGNIPEDALQAAPEGVLVSAPATARAARPRPARALSDSAPRRRGVRAPEVVFRAELASGTVPSIRAIRRQMKVGHPKAVSIRGDLAALVENRAVQPVADAA